MQKYLARAGIASRRAAETWIAEGRVRVNGRAVTEMGLKVFPDDLVEVDGRRVVPERTPVYILLYKPANVVTTVSDPQGRKTVMDLVKGIPERLFPVGRLDYETTGALLLTNDGTLAHRLMHPRHGLKKTYEVLVEGVVDDATVQALEEGVVLPGEEDQRPTAGSVCRILGTDGQTTLLQLTIQEGRNRQVRRMMEAVDHPCLRLKRTGYGPLSLAGLRPGQWRHLRPDEVAALKGGAVRPNRRRGGDRVGRKPQEIHRRSFLQRHR